MTGGDSVPNSAILSLYNPERQCPTFRQAQRGKGTNDPPMIYHAPPAPGGAYPAHSV